MFSKQCELSLFSVSKNSSLKSVTSLSGKGSSVARPRYKTTKEVVELLGLENDYLLRKARSNGSSYRSDRYIAVPAGHNKWELFKLCKS